MPYTAYTSLTSRHVSWLGLVNCGDETAEMPEIKGLMFMFAV